MQISTVSGDMSLDIIRTWVYIYIYSQYIYTYIYSIINKTHSRMFRTNICTSSARKKICEKIYEAIININARLNDF